jgi:hypothetical protein
MLANFWWGNQLESSHTEVHYYVTLRWIKVMRLENEAQDDFLYTV